MAICHGRVGGALFFLQDNLYVVIFIHVKHFIFCVLFFNLILTGVVSVTPAPKTEQTWMSSEKITVFYGMKKMKVKGTGNNFFTGLELIIVSVLFFICSAQYSAH